jgi:hypothetical protein
LVKRGLVGVQLAISDAHAGLKAAIAKVLGCAWQRCTVHFLRDCFGHARKDQHGLLGALIRPIFNADSLEQARDRLSEAVAHLDGRLGKIASMLEDAEAEILGFYAFPPSHWRKLRSTNPLERFNREIGRRTDVVGIFPDDRSLIRLAGMLCIEQNDCHEGLAVRGGGPSSPRRRLGAGPATHSRREEDRMQYLGIDWGTRRTAWCAISPGGELTEGTITADEDGLVRLVTRLGPEVHGCIEMMSGAPWVRDSLAVCGWTIQIADARKVKAIAPLACKTDRVDARVLADLARRDLVPTLWVRPIEDRGSASNCAGART